MNRLAMIAVGILTLSGCQTLPLQNIDNAPVHMATRNYGLGDVEKAIIRAGTNLGWQMRTVKPGLVNGKLYHEDMVAEVSIPFSPSLYSIKYLTSTNLSYSAKAGKPEMIYKDYNSWIQDLDREIRKEMLAKP
jgi:hypothetical protein